MNKLKKKYRRFSEYALWKVKLIIHFNMLFFNVEKDIINSFIIIVPKQVTLMNTRFFFKMIFVPWSEKE